MAWKVGLVLLMCWGFTSSKPHEELQSSTESPPADLNMVPLETLDFGFVPEVGYETQTLYEPGAIGSLFQLVHAFLYMVQPNPFPKDFIVKILQQNLRGFNPAELQKPENIVLTLQVLYYELGFLVLVMLGVLFVLLMPLLGCCFCLCRCCGNCGGELHQRHRKNADCWRSFHATSLLLSSIFIALGVLIAYTANHNISTKIKTTRHIVNTNIRDLKLFANYTPTQIDYLTAQYTTAKNKVLSDLDNIGPLLGGRIRRQLEKEVVPALDKALHMTGAMRETREALESLSASVEVLQEDTGHLQRALQSERISLTTTLSDPACERGEMARTCNTIRAALGQLALNSDFRGLPDINTQLSKLETVMKTDLSYIIQKGYSAFNDIPRVVSEQTKGVNPRVKALLDKSGAEIVNFVKMFPVEPAVDNFTKFLAEGQKKIEAYYPQIDQLDFYRWVGCVALCCVLVLILAFNLLGLLCGTCGYDKNATPTTRGCLSNNGGNLLMAGVGISFIFSWVLMGVVVPIFFTGGNMEKLVCEPLGSAQLFEVIDTPYLVHPGKKNFLPGLLFQDPEIDLTMGSLYRDCYKNNGIYAALHLENKFSFSKFINTTVFNDELTEIFEGLNVDLQGIILLEQEGKDNLINFANTGLGEINYQAYLSVVNKGVTAGDLLSFTNELETQADQLPRGALANALRGHASSIRHIHKTQVVPKEQAMSSLSQSIRLLQTTSKELPSKVTNVLSAIEAVEYLITSNATHIVKQETDKYVKNMLGYFRQYTHWVQHSLTTDVAQCKPISNIIDSLEIIGCRFIIDSVNTIWFGLGGCSLFLIPSIITSVKLAKFYRRMDTEDVLDDYPSYDTMTRYPPASAPPRQLDW
ncbi:prominin 1 b [Electrophorus electricus]|uniref:prominin 1 b n=1 Tax=Electrophorus electricus TaxID=8005 RepID=UPI000F0A3F4D|nr:prominin 1 b [Electrophorus electricus]